MSTLEQEFSRQLVIIDVETSGLEPHDICVEVGWHVAATGEHGSFVPAHDVTWVLEHGHPRALAINGYRERLQHAPQDDGTEVARLHRIVAGKTLGGSNVRTDAAHMARLHDAAGLEREPWHHRLAELPSYAAGVLGLPITDLPGLWACCELLGVDTEDDVHSAAGGAAATARCFAALARLAGGASMRATEPGRHRNYPLPGDPDEDHWPMSTGLVEDVAETLVRHRYPELTRADYMALRSAMFRYVAGGVSW